MGSIRASIEVNVPVSTAYNQWTQFEEFPRFMEGVESVTQLDDTHVRWAAEIAGKRHEWESEITHQEPDRLVAWRATDGKDNAGQVIFDRISDDRTRIDVEMSYDTEGIVEQLGSAVGLDERRVEGDLERFKELIESRGTESGAWRGEVRQGEVAS